MNSLKKAVVWAFFCYTGALFGMENKIVWSLKYIEENKSTIFYKKITDESKYAALYLVNNFNDKLTKEKTTTILRSFSSGQLQLFFRSIQDYAKNRAKSRELYELAPLLISSKAYTVISKILLAMDSNTIKFLDDDLIKQHAEAYLTDIIESPANHHLELAAIATVPELYTSERIYPLQHAIGEDTLLQLFRNALPGFLVQKTKNVSVGLGMRMFKKLKKSLHRFSSGAKGVVGKPGVYDPDPFLLIQRIIGEKSTEKSKNKMLIYPDQLVHQLSPTYLKEILETIDKNTAVGIIKKLAVIAIPKFYNALPQTLQVDQDVIINSAKGLLSCPAKTLTAQKNIEIVAWAFGCELAGQETPENKNRKELVEKICGSLNVESAKKLLASIKDPQYHQMYTRIFNKLSPVTQQAIRPITLTLTTGLFSGMALTYAFFNWKNWGDIKNRNVFLPLAAGLFPVLYTKKTCNQNTLYYGPLAGTLARLFVQSQQNGGFTNFAKRSYMDTQRVNQDMFIANIGAITGFLAGLFDIGFVNTIVSPIQALFNKQKPVNQKLPAEKYAPIHITKRVATTGCYLIKTGISMISPAYTRLIETTEYAGKTTRSILQKVGLP